MTESSPQMTLKLFVAFLAEQKLREGKKWRAIGAELGCSSANAHNVWKLKTGVGPIFERALAAKLTGGDRGKLDRMVAAWHTENPHWQPSWVKADPWATLNGWTDAATKGARNHPELAEEIRAVGGRPIIEELRPRRATPAFVVRLVQLYLAKETEADELEAKSKREKMRRDSGTMPVGRQ